MRRLLLALVSSFALATAALAADPVGTYEVEGAEPGGANPYKGTVVVEKSGETYKVIWNVDGERYVGTGIGNNEFIAVSYTSKSESGLALYGADGSGWKGVWAYSGASKLAPENWKRK